MQKTQYKDLYCDTDAKQVTGGGGGQRLLTTDLRSNPDHQEGGLRSLITILSLGFLV